MTETKEYTRKDKIKRANHQFKNLVTKINYNGRLVSLGSKFGRNTMCRCLSGKKFKHCCIANHEHNQRKQMQLQIAVRKLLDRVSRYGFRVARIGGIRT